MNRSQFMVDITTAIDQAKRPDDLLAVLARAGADCGFDRACGITALPTRTSLLPSYTFVHKWPAGWHERYLEREYLAVDPIIQRIRRSQVPFQWRDVRCERDQQSDAWDMMMEATEFRLSTGFNVPVQTVSGEVGTVMFGGDRYDADPAMLKALIVIGIYAHIRAMEMMGERPNARTWEHKLSRRELEVLKWSSHGKNSQQIADRLNISLPTVETHLANTYRKLKASNKVEAVAIALRNGFID
ncbi:helix-turn-helix transcriptional regulator [Phreatobacter sp.]|uniref:helix-turn-helix transcriptional regulator n=1 Tax=Phreatobacter sp. TaxID=1966341 RepID=UPI003F71E313